MVAGKVGLGDCEGKLWLNLRLQAQMIVLEDVWMTGGVWGTSRLADCPTRAGIVRAQHIADQNTSGAQTTQYAQRHAWWH